MIIKSFTAESAAAALKHVRSEMGGDAVVLKTRHVTVGSGAKHFEVTACLDKPIASAPSAPAERRISTPRWKPVNTDKPSVPSAAAPAIPAPDMVTGLAERLDRLESKLDRLGDRTLTDAIEAVATNPLLDELQARLTAADVPEVFRSVFLATVGRELQGSDSVHEDAHRLLVDSLADLLEPALTFEHGDVVVLMGAAGAGKTSLLGKLAAHLVMTEHKRVRLLSIDSSKVGAHDEIESYAALLGIEVAARPNSAGASDPTCVTLIDSPALPTTVEAFAEFARRLEHLKPSHRLAVFSALTRTSDVTKQARQMRVLAPTHFAFSMTDLTACHGAVIAAAETLAVKLALVTSSPGGLGRANAPDPLRLAEQLLSPETEVTHE